MYSDTNQELKNPYNFVIGEKLLKIFLSQFNKKVKCTQIKNSKKYFLNYIILKIRICPKLIERYFHSSEKLASLVSVLQLALSALSKLTIELCLPVALSLLVGCSTCFGLHLFVWHKACSSGIKICLSRVT